ncbi:hypothetical protein ACIRD3_30100 [Kitasatospora sp. NPDC093550]|uniref:hypothetical protein n=1 Tax=Kitasatospora sp. NPDC093550 TaxID=3364089 RepID=UPI0038006D58
MSNGSTAGPSTAAARAGRAAVLLVSGALVLGACSLLRSSDGGWGTASEPRRVESREQALTRTDQVQDHVRELTGLERNPWIKIVGYFRCPGRGTGMAEQGEAYQLRSAIQLKATDDQRPEVFRSLREKLAAEGFKITEPESGPAGRDFDAVHASEGYTVSLEARTEPGTGVLVSVALPCQAPPSGAAAPTPTATG